MAWRRRALRPRKRKLWAHAQEHIQGHVLGQSLWFLKNNFSPMWLEYWVVCRFLMRWTLNLKHWEEFTRCEDFLCRSPKRRRSRSRSGSRKRKHRKRSRSRSRDRKRKSSRSYSSERRAREREKERQKKGLPPIRSKTLSGTWRLVVSESYFAFFPFTAFTWTCFIIWPC